MLAQVTNQTPWWGVSVVAGVFALLGVLIAQAVAYLNERRKEKRRLDSDVRAVCTRLLTASLAWSKAEGMSKIEWDELHDAAVALQFITPVSVATAGADLMLSVMADKIDGTVAVEGREILPPAKARATFTNALREWLGLDTLDETRML